MDRKAGVFGAIANVSQICKPPLAMFTRIYLQPEYLMLLLIVSLAISIRLSFAVFEMLDLLIHRLAGGQLSYGA